MNIFEKSRFAVYSQRQHPYRHVLSEFAFNNPLIPGASNVEDAINYITAVLYPNYIGTFATPAALPVLAANNDYAIVTDDGDGKSAGYVYHVLDGVSQWIKRYDVDWSLEGIFAETINRTQYMYVHKYGFDDHDATGVDLVGLYAGQTIYGGESAGSNLTLNANATDAAGYVQSDNTFRPTSTNALDLGTGALMWRRGYFATEVLVGTLSLSPGVIDDSSGDISFTDNNLTTTGNITGTSGFFSGSVAIGPFAGDALLLGPGSITDESGAISFDNENLVTTGTFTASTLTVLNGGDSLVLSDQGAFHQISSNLDDIRFDGATLQDIAAILAGTATLTTANLGNLSVAGNTISAANLNGNVNLLANGVGVVDVQSPLTTLDVTTTGTLSVTGILNADNLRLDGNSILSTNVNGAIVLDPNGTGIVQVSSDLAPTADDAFALGLAAFRWNTIYFSDFLSDGTEAISSSTLLSFRNANVGAVDGDVLFYDSGTGTWLPSAPDSEIDHGTLSGLADDDHPQYALLVGRAGGQSLVGGTAASENLIFESTSHATKGTVQTKDNFVPFTNASFSVTWSGTDLGDATHYFRDIYLKGEARGLRLENFTTGTLPAFSAANRGRIVWLTDTNSARVDSGSAWLTIGGGGGGLGTVRWYAPDSGGAFRSVLANGQETFAFTDLEQSTVFGQITIPEGYITGTQIFLKYGKAFSSLNTGNFKFSVNTRIFKSGVSGVGTPTANAFSTGNISVGATANFIVDVTSLELTSNIGEINGVPVQPGDMLLIELYRLPSGETSSVAADVSLLIDSLVPDVTA